jgi:hypothetical protein
MSKKWEIVMKMFVLQNPDYKNLFWSEELGWVDLNNADPFFGTELDDKFCIELKLKTLGKWVMEDYKFTVEKL